MKNKQIDITDEKESSVPNLYLNIDFDEVNFIRLEFRQKLKWFEDEFDLILGGKTQNITEMDGKLAFAILDRLSETINQYRDKGVVFELVNTLNNIEKKYPRFF